MNESELNTKHVWFLGNNLSPTLKISPPSWDKPFFLSASKDYAESYSDYGVYKITLKNAVTGSICDFSKAVDINKLGWPSIVIKQLRSGKTDMNRIALFMYNFSLGIASDDDQIVQDDDQWEQAVAYFDEVEVLDPVRKRHWSHEDDYFYLRTMWSDLVRKGFVGFTHKEFGVDVIGIFEVSAIDKISKERIA